MLIGWQELLQWREMQRKAKMTIAWTNGCFDLLHIGHLRSLTEARRFADWLIVGVNSDESVKRLKGRVIVPAEQRAELVQNVFPVHYAVIFGEDTACKAVEKLKPEVYCKGAEYRDRPMPESEVVRSYGGRIEFLPMVDGVSTTEMIRRIRA